MGAVVLDEFVSKYLVKGIDNLSKEELNELGDHFLRKVLTDIIYVKDNFFKNPKNENEWSEFRKNKDSDYLLSLLIAGTLMDEYKKKGTTTSAQKFCHECGAKLIK
ncbi:MAG: hypothetical protein V1494_03880 [Candidatus Diapherotrites archaeon]